MGFAFSITLRLINAEAQESPIFSDLLQIALQ